MVLLMVQKTLVITAEMTHDRIVVTCTMDGFGCGAYSIDPKSPANRCHIQHAASDTLEYLADS